MKTAHHFLVFLLLAAISCRASVTNRPSGESRATMPQTEGKQYVCPACGRECDKKAFDAPGTCPDCAMTLIEKPVAQSPSSGKATSVKTGGKLAGSWAGSYQIGDKQVAIKLVVDGADGSAKVDVLALDQGLDLKLRPETGGHLGGSFVRNGLTTDLDLHAEGSALVGRAQSGSQSGAAQLVKLADPPITTLRGYQGLYQAGSRFFACEVLNDYWGLTFTEYPSGEVRGMFPTSGTEFVMGSMLMFAAPVERTVRFTTGNLILQEGSKQTVATKVNLPTREVKFQNGDVTLAGTIILPAGKGRHPGIVFLSGSGPEPRNTFMGQGYWLAYNGMACLKYDKRGAGDSTGSAHSRFTYEALGQDGAAGARFLASQPEVDPNRIGFWGISEGGWTSVLAAAYFENSAFVIALSGCGLTPSHGELLDSEDQLRTDGRFSEKEIAEAVQFQALRDHYMQTGEGWDEYFAARKSAVTKKWWLYPSTDLFGPSKQENPFWKEKAQSYFYDPVPTLKKLKCPLLTIVGQRDTPKLATESFAAVKGAMESSGNRDYENVLLPKAGHNMFEAETSNEDALPHTKRLASDYIPLLTGWLQKHVGLGRAK